MTITDFLNEETGTTNCRDCNKQLTDTQLANHNYRCSACVKKRNRKERICKECNIEFIGNNTLCPPCERRQPANRYDFAKCKANSREIVWSLSRKEYLEAISVACYYCSGALGQTVSRLWIGSRR